MKKLDTMTTEQEAQMLQYREEWMKLGHSTEPLDLVKVEEVAERLYGLIDKSKPQVIHCQSPWQMAMTVAAFKEIGKMEAPNLWSNLWSNLRSNLESNLWSNLESNLRSNLESNLWSNLRSNLWSNLGSNLESNLWSNLWSNLGSNLESNLRSNLRSNLESNLWSNLESNLSEIAKSEYSWWTFYGPWYLYWLAFYDFPRKFLRLTNLYSKEDNHALDIWIDLANSVAGWAAYEGVFFVCERPVILKVDSNNRLHCTDGPAIRYSDGLEFYYLHGIHIENINYILAPLTVEQIENEPNVETRRVLIDKYGQAEYLMDSGAQKVHEDDFGVLYKKDIGDTEPVMMVKVVNSSKEPDGTYKDYWLGVDPKSYGGLKTAQAAVASTWRYEDQSLVFSSPEHYRPLVET